MLKLLSPQQIKDAKNQELAKQVLRTKEVQEAIKDVNMKLANAEADFAQALADHRKKWEQEDEEHRQWVKETSKEVKELEQKRADALVPIEIEKKKVDNLFKEARELHEFLKQKEADLEETKELVEIRLSDISDIKVSIKEKEAKLNNREKAIEEQAKMVQQSSQKLTKELADFAAKKALEEQLLEKRRKELTLAEINVEAKFDAINRNLEAIKVKEAQLEDQRQTLEREYKRRGLSF